MQYLLLPIAFVIGSLQVVATLDGLVHLIPLPEFLVYPLALLFGWTPIIGTALGVMGAALVWDWGWLNASLLFVGPWILILIGAFVTTFLDR